MPQAACCAHVKPPAGVVSVQPAEPGAACAAGWLQRPHVAAHRPSLTSQSALQWPHRRRCEQAVPSLGWRSMQVPVGEVAGGAAAAAPACWSQRPQVDLQKPPETSQLSEHCG